MTRALAAPRCEPTVRRFLRRARRLRTCRPQVHLRVDDLGDDTGEIAAASATGIVIEGTPTARTITGAVAAVNTYLATKGNVTYRTALDDTRAVTLTTRVSDGTDTAVVTSQINVKPVNDAPTIAAAISLAGQLTGGFIDITADTILASGNARDVDSQKLSVVVQSVLAGTLQRQVGSKWVPITAKSSLAQRRFSPGQMLRWTPPAGGAGSVQAFQVKAADESLQSETLGTVSVVAG